jgi:hypothetical protein
MFSESLYQSLFSFSGVVVPPSRFAVAVDSSARASPARALAPAALDALDAFAAFSGRRVDVWY